MAYTNSAFIHERWRMALTLFRMKDLWTYNPPANMTPWLSFWQMWASVFSFSNFITDGRNLDLYFVFFSFCKIKGNYMVHSALGAGLFIWRFGYDYLMQVYGIWHDYGKQWSRLFFLPLPQHGYYHVLYTWYFKIILPKRNYYFNIRISWNCW